MRSDFQWEILVIINFQDANGIRLHDQFQRWREENERGYFLCFRRSTRAILHVSLCPHPGSVEWDGWAPSPRQRVMMSLTNHRKVCGIDQSELLRWADQSHITYRGCKHCLPAGYKAQRSKKVDYSDYAEESQPFLCSGEIAVDSVYEDGLARRVEVDRYERDPRNRRACIEHYRAICIVCGFESSKVYRGIKAGYIHVHHLRPVSKGKRQIDPKKDLVPVCPNCHAMLHTTVPPLTPATLKRHLLKSASQI